MSETIPYYNNITESFHSVQLESASPDFDLLRFEHVPQHEMHKKPFRLNAFVIGLFTGGSAQVQLNAQQYELKRGSLYFSTPWHIRQYAAIHNWQGYVLFFTPQYIYQHKPTEDIARAFSFFQAENGLVMNLEEDALQQLEQLFKEMTRILASDVADRYKILFHYLNILLYNCKHLVGEVEVAVNGKGDYVINQFLNHLNDYFVKLSKNNTKDELTLKGVAAAMHLHPNYLSNLVKEHTGKSAAQLIRERVTLEAQALLNNTDMTVAEIAYYLQFKDTSNFAKFFKSITGVSPSSFRLEKKGPGNH